MIKTSKENREIVARLSRKLGLGSENHISRIAFSYSVNSDKKLQCTKMLKYVESIEKQMDASEFGARKTHLACISCIVPGTFFRRVEFHSTHFNVF